MNFFKTSRLSKSFHSPTAINLTGAPLYDPGPCQHYCAELHFQNHKFFNSTILLSGDDDLYAGDDFSIDLSGDLRPDRLGESDLLVGEDGLWGLDDRLLELVWLVIRDVLVKLVLSTVVGERVDRRNSWDILSLIVTVIWEGNSSLMNQPNRLQAWYLTEAIASVAPGLCLGALSKVPIEIYKIPHRGALCQGKIALPLQVQSIRPEVTQ